MLKKTDKRNDATRTKELEEAGRTDSHFVISLVQKSVFWNAEAEIFHHLLSCNRGQHRVSCSLERANNMLQVHLEPINQKWQKTFLWSINIILADPSPVLYVEKKDALFIKKIEVIWNLLPTCRTVIVTVANRLIMTMIRTETQTQTKHAQAAPCLDHDRSGLGGSTPEISSATAGWRLARAVVMTLLWQSVNTKQFTSAWKIDPR